MRQVLWLSVAVLFFLQQTAPRKLDRFPHLYEMQFQPAWALQDTSGVLLGLRRLLADIAFIQLLEYYGSHEELGTESHSRVGADHRGSHYDRAGVPAKRDGEEMVEAERRKPHPQLLAKTARILQLDPYYHYACLYGAGALIFNLNRPAEGVQLLRIGLEWDPGHWPYRLALASLAYKHWKDFRHLILILEQAVNYPDCPLLFKNILANLYKKTGQMPKAIGIYEAMLRDRDPGYAQHAERELAKLGLR